MTVRLEREGIFKARPTAWSVYQADSGAVGINMAFVVLSQLDGGEWVSWQEYEEHAVYGTIWIVKKDGTVLDKNVEDLYNALGWDGAMSAFTGPVPDRVVQVTVRAEEYKGKAQFKVAFIAPENYSPGPQGAAPDDIKKIEARFGSLLRAAVAEAKRGSGKPKSAAPTPAAAAPTPAPAATPAPAPSDASPPMAPEPWTREAALQRLREASRADVKAALTAAKLHQVVNRPSDIEALDDGRLRVLDEALFNEVIPF